LRAGPFCVCCSLRLPNRTGLLFLVGGDFGEDFGAVDVRVYLGPEFDDFAFRRDEEGLARGKLHISVGHEGDAVEIDDLMVGVGEHLEVEGVLGAPGFVVGDGVEADAEDHGIEGVIFIEVALEVVRFDGAAPGLVLGVEVEDDPFALELGEADKLVFLRGQSKVGCGCADGDHVGRGCCVGLDADSTCCDYGDCDYGGPDSFMHRGSSFSWIFGSIEC